MVERPSNASFTTDSLVLIAQLECRTNNSITPRTFVKDCVIEDIEDHVTSSRWESYGIALSNEEAVRRSDSLPPPAPTASRAVV